MLSAEATVLFCPQLLLEHVSIDQLSVLQRLSLLAFSNALCSILKRAHKHYIIIDVVLVCICFVRYVAADTHVPNGDSIAGC